MTDRSDSRTDGDAMGGGTASQRADRAALVIEAASEGIYDWNIETNDVWVSDRLNELFGFEDGEL